QILLPTDIGGIVVEPTHRPLGRRTVPPAAGGPVRAPPRRVDRALPVDVGAGIGGVVQNGQHLIDGGRLPQDRVRGRAAQRPDRHR
ncbi:hypothetical protein RZS08_36520, partial [Arthrospira platensis SPKY1]|nr:hypothetical protein [Arthrospira platensis SPKY1]